MIGILPSEDATAAMIKMDRGQSIINAAMLTKIGGFNERTQAAQDLMRLSERLADIARRIDPIQSGDFALALSANGNLTALQMRD